MLARKSRGAMAAKSRVSKKRTSYPDGVLSLTTPRFGKEAWSFCYALRGRRLAISTTQKGGSTPYTGQAGMSEQKRRERAIVSA
jgi:hypothetical protein